MKAKQAGGRGNANSMKFEAAIGAEASNLEVVGAHVQVESAHTRVLLGPIASVADRRLAGPQSSSAKTQQLSVRKPISSFIR